MSRQSSTASRLSLPITSVAPSGSQKAQSATSEKPASTHSVVLGQRVAEPAHQLEMIAGARDRIEIGDIEGGRPGHAEQPAGDRHGVVSRAERAWDGRIIGAPPRHGMDRDAALEIENRDDGEIAHGVDLGVLSLPA